MCGDESLRGCLRILTCIELYNNVDYYANHPSFQTEWRSPNCKFEAYDSIFTVSISDGAYDKLNEKCTNKEEFIKEEAVLLAEHKVWTSLICMFALSSVIGAKIASYHPPYGNNAIKHFFNSFFNQPKLQGKPMVLLCTICFHLYFHPIVQNFSKE